MIKSKRDKDGEIEGEGDRKEERDGGRDRQIGEYWSNNCSGPHVGSTNDIKADPIISQKLTKSSLDDASNNKH